MRNPSVANLRDVTDDLPTLAIGKNTVMFILVTNPTIARFAVVTNPTLTHQVLENI